LQPERVYEAVVRLLVEKGADIAVKFLGRAKVLHAAALKGQVAMIRLLLRDRGRHWDEG
jgi:ankyrin repeat protein